MILDLAANCSIVSKSGSWYAYNGEKIGQGRENAKQYLAEHADICGEIENLVRTRFKVRPTDPDDSAGQDSNPSEGTAPAVENASPWTAAPVFNDRSGNDAPSDAEKAS